RRVGGGRRRDRSGRRGRRRRRSGSRHRDAGLVVGSRSAAERRHEDKRDEDRLGHVGDAFGGVKRSLPPKRWGPFNRSARADSNRNARDKRHVYSARVTSADSRVLSFLRIFSFLALGSFVAPAGCIGVSQKKVTAGGAIGGTGQD